MPPSRWIAGIVFAGCAAAANFSGASAYQFAKRAVEFGPRPPGSPANRQLQTYITTQLKADGAQLIDDSFTAKTPILGDVTMKNLIAKFPGKSGRAIVITGHFDTKYFPKRKFVGANDAGSSTGLLLELARVMAHEPRTDDLYIVFFDGEEAVREEWEGEDNLYGSRHLAERWRKDGTLSRIRALINVDMIGDKHLNIKREMQSDRKVRELVWKTAAELGYQAYFTDETINEDDDHMPFLKLGVPALDIIDVDYPPWHTDDDTLDKISAQSLEIVGTVVKDAIRRLQQ